MATMLHSESRRLYSWWWDSHIPKNSKWLQDNLTDMDAKVKAMIKLIEEDADSFARRAEMYYKKRPELMKLVEEFYRAYRALAERYDHATVELRQAHRTMAEAFPNQVPLLLTEDSPSGSSAHEAEPHTPEMPHPIRALLDPDEFDLHAIKRGGSFSEELDSGISKRGLKQLNEMFGNSKFTEGITRKDPNNEMEELSNENQNLKSKIVSESERAGKAENEVENLKKTLFDMEAEKEAIFLQYQRSLENISNLEGELNHAQNNFVGLDQKASKAEIEIRTLKQAIVELEAERDHGSLRHEEFLDRISNMESMISLAHENANGLNERATEADFETQYLKKELSKLETEKEAGLLQYKQCLAMISDLENKLALAEEEAKVLRERAHRAETEVKKLEQVLAELNEQKEAATLQYSHYLEKISKMDSEIACAKEDFERLNSEILMGAEKLKNSEEKSALLEISNQSLKLEADNLAKKIEIKDQELLEKHQELEKLQISIQNEHLGFVQIESTLQTLQNLHSRSQEEQRALTLELKNGIQMLKDMEICKNGLEEELKRVKDENQNLNELNSSLAISTKNLQNEILSLRELKERLEEEVESQTSRSTNLEQEIFQLKEEIKNLNMIYQALMEESQDENLKLRQKCEQERGEKEVLSMKLLETNTVFEISLSHVNSELEVSQEKIKELQESSQFIREETSALVAEKASLLSQLQNVTENMLKLQEKNTILENSLYGMNVELERLREKSKSLEDICKSLNSEKSNLLTERGNLAIQLENVEKRLENLERRFAELEVKHAGLEMEKETTLGQIEELKFSLGVEKQERASFEQSNNTRLVSLEKHIDLLQEESRWRKKEFEEELDKAVNAQFEIFILKRFIQDMEEKNYALLMECQKHVDASRLAEKLISELEDENLEQQMESEFVLDEIEKLRNGIYQVFKAIEIGSDKGFEVKIENEQVYIHHALRNIQDMKCSLSKLKDDKEQMRVENSVLLTLLEQLGNEGLEIDSEKKIMAEELVMVWNEKHELIEMSKQLRSEVRKGDQKVNVLEAEMVGISVKQEDLQRAYLELQEKYAKVLEENKYLLKKSSDLMDEKCLVEEENDVILLEALALGNLSVIFKSFMTEKAVELKALNEDMLNLRGFNGDLDKEVSSLSGKIEMKETENLLLKDSVEKLYKELHEVRDINNQLTEENSSGKVFLQQKEKELSETEERLKAIEKLNSELSGDVEGLTRECEESRLLGENLEKKILELSEDKTSQGKEVLGLCEVNENLASQIDILREEIEEHRIREENLTSKLQERSNEFELWEDEASSFYFDLQISAIREVLIENKIHELGGVCESLEDESASKTMEMEAMKGRVSFMESEIEGLKSQLFAYAPLTVSLRENIASLEQNIIGRTKLNSADKHETKVVDSAVHLHGKSGLEKNEDKNSVPNGISDMHELQTRIKGVEMLVVEEMDRLALQESLTSNIELEAAMREIEELKFKLQQVLQNDKQKEQRELYDEFGGNDHKSRKTKSEGSEMRDATLMKDIPLDHVSEGLLNEAHKRGSGGPNDQMLELWQTDDDPTVNETQREAFETIEEDIEPPSLELQVERELRVDKLEVSSTVIEPNQETNKRKILERLASDAQKLTSLRNTVEDLKRKLEVNKKVKKAKDVDIETVKEQLQEVEETVVQRMDTNCTLIRNVEEGLWCSGEKASTELEEGRNVQRKRVTEQARKESEKLGRLQLEVQKIQYVLLKFEDGKKSKGGKRFSRSRTSIILRDFIHRGKKGSERKRKSRLCGCWRSSTRGDGELHNNAY